MLEKTNVYRAREFSSAFKAVFEEGNERLSAPRTTLNLKKKQMTTSRKLVNRSAEIRDSVSELLDKHKGCARWISRASPRQRASPLRLLREGVPCEIRHERVAPYSPRLASCERFSFPKIESETRFDSAEKQKLRRSSTIWHGRIISSIAFDNGTFVRCVVRDEYVEVVETF